MPAPSVLQTVQENNACCVPCIAKPAIPVAAPIAAEIPKIMGSAAGVFKIYVNAIHKQRHCHY